MRTSARPAQAGPHPGALAVVVTALTLLAVAVPAALGGVVPSPDGGGVAAWVRTQPDAVRAAAVFTTGASVPLAILAGTLYTRLRRLGVTAPGAAIAFAGGTVAAGTLAGSGLLLWVLSRSEVRAGGPVVRALHDLAFAAGGPAHVVFLGLLVAGVAVPGLLLRLLPGPFATAGLVVAATSELSFVVLVWSGAAVLVPIGRFASLAWLVAAGFLLPARRRPAADRPSGGPR